MEMEVNWEAEQQANKPSEYLNYSYNFILPKTG